MQWKSFYREFGSAGAGRRRDDRARARRRALAGGRVEPQPQEGTDASRPGTSSWRSAAACRAASTSRATSTGLAFALTEATKYVGEPVLVIGGGTSAAEAVIAISGAKNSAGDPTDVYWSYRGDKMPKVSRALADEFFDAFVGNGNVRYLPSERAGRGARSRRGIVSVGADQPRRRRRAARRRRRSSSSRRATASPASARTFPVQLLDSDRRAARWPAGRPTRSASSSARCSRRGSRTSISPARAEPRLLRDDRVRRSRRRSRRSSAATTSRRRCATACWWRKSSSRSWPARR